MSTCGRELTLLSRTKTLYASVINKQFRGYARRYNRTPVHVLTADEEKREFIDKKVAFRDRIRDFDRRDPVLSNLTQSKDLDRLKSLPKIRKPALDMDVFQDWENNRKPKRYTNDKKEFNNPNNAERRNDSKRSSFTKDKAMPEYGDKVRNEKGQAKNKENKKDKRSANTSAANKRQPVEQRTMSGVKYTILGSEDKKVGILLRTARSKKLRNNDRIILLEGSTLISDALQAGGKPKSIYFANFDALKRLPIEHLQEVPVYKCEEHHMNRWSDVVSTADVIALFEMPEDGKVFLKSQTTIPLTIILDQIRTPGNMGTIIRSAAAVGCERIIAMQNCVDLWDPKVTRAGAGCHFRVPFHQNVTWKYVENYIPVGARIYLSDKRRPTDKRVTKYTDPMDNGSNIDSLGYNQDDYESDPESDLILNTSFNDSQVLNEYQHAPLPVSYYSEMDYSRNDHTVLVIGGETRGISLEARKLAYDMYGQCVMIPMTNGVESLNTSVAASVLMFEIYKQLGMQTNEQANVAASGEGVTVESVNEPTGVSASGEGVTVESVNEPTGVSPSGDGVTVESVNEPTGVSASGEVIKSVSVQTGASTGGDGVADTVESVNEPTGASTSGEGIKSVSEQTGASTGGEGVKSKPKSASDESMKSAPQEKENQGVLKNFLKSIFK
ncbi:rRNA methyltransferase 3, mitochondrial-like [Mizuhopecten yessoensis]|uniref:rRNA methyltransferase 3, mitochondrial-like n=1 Tax=Mizuhopecten yessoensis TaxID=6573 RepID=UPI000B459535|nr:rRNA methyltransferase 3, mitochondrial-like [Mizuhopecten yessoensis]